LKLGWTAPAFAKATAGQGVGFDPQKETGMAILRSRNDRVIAGVCGGIARSLGWNSTTVRVLYVLVSILSVAFPGILVYIILWVVMPLEP